MNKIIYLRTLCVLLLSLLPLSKGWTQTPESTPNSPVTLPQTQVPAQPDAQLLGSAKVEEAADLKQTEAEAKTEANTPPPDPPTAVMECSPSPVAVAAPVSCVVTITHPVDMTVKVNAPPGAENGAATLPKPNDQGQLITQRLFTLRQVELNKPLRVKDVRVVWSAVGGHEGVVKLPNQKIPLRSLLMGVSAPVARDFAQPTGIKAEVGDQKAELAAAKQASEKQAFWQRHAPPSLLETNWTLIVILIILAMSVVGAFLGWLIRIWAEARARRKAPYVDPRPAHEIAYEALKGLEKARLIEDGAFKIYSQRLSEIARAYFGKRYDFNGLEMTSDELRASLSTQDLSPEAYLVLEDFLSDTDLIKFADLNTSASALNESCHRVYRLIELTKAEPQEEESQDANDEASQQPSQEESKA